MSKLAAFPRHPFFTHGLPFMLMVVGATFVLARVRTERYSHYRQMTLTDRTRRGQMLTSLEQDVEVGLFPATVSGL